MRLRWMFLLLMSLSLAVGCPDADDDDSAADDDDATADDDDATADDDDATADDDDATADDDDATADDDDATADDDDATADDDDATADDDDATADDDDATADDDDATADDDDSADDDDDSAAITLDSVVLSADPTTPDTREASTLEVIANYSDGNAVFITLASDLTFDVTDFGDATPLRTDFELESVTAGSVEVFVTFDGMDSNTVTVNFVPSPVQADDFVVNELLADGTAGDANGDGSTSADEDTFVEFVNVSGVEVGLGGAQVFDNDLDNSLARHTFGSLASVLPGNAVVVFGGGSPVAAPANAEFFAADNANDPGNPFYLALDPTGDAIRLRDAAGGLITELVYGSLAGGTPDANIDESINLDPDVSGTTYDAHTTVSGSGTSFFSPGVMSDGSSF